MATDRAREAPADADYLSAWYPKAGNAGARVTLSACR